MTLIARLVVAIVTGWLAAGCAIAVFLQLFSRSQMNYLGVVAVLLGLCVVGACWRATRTWGPRRATPAELEKGLDVHLGYPFLTYLVLIGILTFGIFGLVFWLQTRRWPRRLDPEGMTLRNGVRLSWNEITEVTGRVRTLGRVPVNTWWEVRAGMVRTDIVPNSLAEGKAVLEFLSRALGRGFPLE